jgi:hypothetical protein
MALFLLEQQAVADARYFITSLFQKHFDPLKISLTEANSHFRNEL